MEKYFEIQVEFWNRSKVNRWIVISLIAMTFLSFSIAIVKNDYSIWFVLNILILIDSALNASFGYSKAKSFKEWWTVPHSQLRKN